MVLYKGARKCYEWLKEKKAGYVASRQEVLDVTGWKDASLTTYFKKNKLAPFLAPIANDRVKVLTDGDQVTVQYFHEVFTQTAPRRVTLTVGDVLEGLDDRYSLQEPLGNGAVGHVWSARLASTQTVQLVAAKVMLPREDLLADSKISNVRERFRRESEYGAHLSHENIVQYIDHGDVQGNPFLIMELGEKSVGKILKEQGSLTIEEAAAVIDNVLSALEYLHGHGMPHRDVKPDNILSFPDRFKLADLGIVKWTDFDPAITTAGTITRSSVQLGSWFYMAPEQQQDPHEAELASDIYALGVSWIEMLDDRS